MLRQISCDPKGLHARRKGRRTAEGQMQKLDALELSKAGGHASMHRVDCRLFGPTQCSWAIDANETNTALAAMLLGTLRYLQRAVESRFQSLFTRTADMKNR